MVFTRSVANLTLSDTKKYLKNGWVPPINTKLVDSGLLPGDLVYLYNEDAELSKKTEKILAK